MKNRLAFWVVVFVSMSLMSLASCGSDEESKGAGGTGGSGGSSASGGSGGTAGQAGTGWKTGVVGTPAGVLALAKEAGNLQGISLVNGMMKTLDLPSEEDGGSGLDAGESLPQTAPKIDSAEMGAGNFNQMVLPILPYIDDAGTLVPPYTMVVDGDWSTETIQHFESWPSQDIDFSCYTPYPTQVNGADMRAYNGFSMDTAICLNRWFLVTNGSTKVWELYPDGTRTVLADLQKPLSAVLCHPQGHLIVSALTTYIQNEGFKVNTPSSIHKVELDGTTQLIAEMPVPNDYATNNMFGLCGAFPGISPAYIPPGMSIFLTMHPDGSLLVGEMGAQRIYNIDGAGEIKEFAAMTELTIGGILAPNEVIYTIVPPMTNQTHDTVHRGAIIRAFANGVWEDVVEIGEYDSFLPSMRHFSRGTPCEEDPSGYCYQPVGSYYKLAAGTTPMIIMTDPIKGELTAVQLDMGGGTDAGIGGTAGSSGAGGEGGSAGSAEN